MKIETIVKSTSNIGKVKYFHDHLQASFHIQTGTGNALEFKIEPCSVLFDGNSYFSLSKFEGDIEGEVNNLVPNTIHGACNKYVETYDGGEMGRSEGYYTLALHKSNYSHSNAFNIVLDENRTVFKVEDQIHIQKAIPEYEAIKPSINDAVARASQRLNAEYKHAASLFSQRKAEFERAQQELERKRAELDMEAKMLASDAMDYSQ